MCGNFRRTSRALTQFYEEELRPLGLRATQFTILQALSLAGEVSQGQLGEMLAMDSTSLTRTLAIMSRKGWITEHRGEDRRERRTMAVRCRRTKAQAGGAGVGESSIATPAEAGAEGLEEPIGTHASSNRASQNRRRIAMNKYGKIIAGLIVVWFVAALTASALDLFKNGSGRFGLGVAVASLTPMVVFALWFAGSGEFRRFALSLNPGILTSIQAWRIVGFTFVLLEARNVLPSVFAWPAGYGDMTIGATAAFVAWKLVEPAHRGSFILWQVLGILDLITAVSLGTTAGLLMPHGPSMVAMTVMPLSLIPTFLVPLFFMLHVICIAQARAWETTLRATPQVTRPLQSPAI